MIVLKTLDDKEQAKTDFILCPICRRKMIKKFKNMRVKTENGVSSTTCQGVVIQCKQCLTEYIIEYDN